jgi:hypothetical protein
VVTVVRPSNATEATKCEDLPDPRRTDAELSPLGESNVPNLRGGGDHIADDNSLTTRRSRRAAILLPGMRRFMRGGKHDQSKPK